MYSYLKFPSQVYHVPSMPQTKFIYFNITCTKTSSAYLHRSQETFYSFVHALEKVGWTIGHVHPSPPRGEASDMT